MFWSLIQPAIGYHCKQWAANERGIHSHVTDLCLLTETAVPSILALWRWSSLLSFSRCLFLSACSCLFSENPSSERSADVTLACARNILSSELLFPFLLIWYQSSLLFSEQLDEMLNVSYTLNSAHFVLLILFLWPLAYLLLISTTITNLIHCNIAYCFFNWSFQNLYMQQV